MKTKKLGALLSVALLSSTLFAGCGSSAGENGTINVFNCADYIDQDLINKFEDETGIKVVYNTYDTNEIMYQKVKSNPGTYDLVFPSDYMIERMISEGLAEEINFDNIPNYSNTDEKFTNLSYDPENKYSVPYMWGTVGILYNTDEVTKEVNSWDILWDSDYADNVYMFNSLRDTMAIALLKTGASSINTTDSAEIEAAKVALLEQKSSVNPVYVVDEVKDNMISGEKAIATVWSGDALYIIDQSGADNLQYVIPEEGSNYWVDGMVIPSDAPNKEGAEAFINFLCDAENAKQNVEYIEYSTPNAAAYELLDEETKTNYIAYPSDEVLSRCTLFTDLDTATLKEYEAAFTEVLSN